jgi:hypothetical protein
LLIPWGHPSRASTTVFSCGASSVSISTTVQYNLLSLQHQQPQGAFSIID